MKLTALILSLTLLVSIGQAQNAHSESGIHEITVEEVLQTTSYTYLLANENGITSWLALPKMDAAVGEVYFYQSGTEMRDFKSAELNRIFDSIMLLPGIQSAETIEKDTAALQNTKPLAKEEKIAIIPVEGSITIAALFANKEIYSNKVVKIKGKVVKFNSNILGKNWIHLQDGSEHEGKNDLTITTDIETQVGDIILIEGMVILNKDFGSGYFYNVIMEEGKIVE